MSLTSDLQQQLQEAVGSAYHIEKELTGAGMSRVFVATEAELERQVVIPAYRVRGQYDYGIERTEHKRNRGFFTHPKRDSRVDISRLTPA